MTFWNDVRLAARLLLKDKWFTLAAVAALALGIAANNTVFTLVNGVLLRDLPFDEPDRIVGVGVRNPPDAPEPARERLVSRCSRLAAQATRTFDGIARLQPKTAMNVVRRGPRAGAVPRRLRLGERLSV